MAVIYSGKIHYNSVQLLIISLRLVHDFVQIFQPMLMAVCTWSLATICGVMLMIQMELVE